MHDFRIRAPMANSRDGFGPQVRAYPRSLAGRAIEERSEREAENSRLLRQAAGAVARRRR